MSLLEKINKIALVPAILALVVVIGLYGYQARQQPVKTKIVAAPPSFTLGPPPGMEPPMEQPATLVVPAPEEQPEVPRTLLRSDALQPPAQYEPTTDILASLNVAIKNDFAGEFGITDDAIRGAADLSYARVGIANPSIKGYTLEVRTTGGGAANTQFFARQRRVIVNIDPVVWHESAAHEMTHVLQGNVIEGNWLPGFLKEFIATAAEDVETKFLDIPFTYERFNRPILSIARTLNREPHQINANNAPLDGLRYDLLRSAGVKLGTERYRQLARKLHDFAYERGAPVPLEEFQPLFADVGLGDCVLFQTAMSTGLYVDVAFLKNGVPMVMYKQVDQNGVESVPMASMRLTWRKDNKALFSWGGGTMPSGMMADDAGARLASFADSYEVTVGTTVYTYNFVD